MIEFNNVNKVFHKKKEKIHALKNISFTINQYDIFGVIGYSGAGKSTLVRLVNQLEHATDGQVIVDGHEINTYKERELRKVKKDIGMIFQHFNLLNSKTVFKNVAMPLILSGKDKKEIQERVDSILKFVGLSDKKNQFPDELSGGQKQRVAIARALITNPKVLLCDEATSALDPATTNSILNLLSNINKTFGVTVMMITHDMSVIQKICNRVAVMENGEVVEIGDVKEVFSNPKTKTAHNFVTTVVNMEPSKSLIESFNQNKNDNDIDLKLFIDQEQIEYPLLNEMINNYHLNVNVLFSSMSEIQGDTVCYMWIRIKKDENYKKFNLNSFFENNKIHYEEV
ncbi:methionine ABC transporter ATP-binding protein [Staphylococcus pasteuri]|uniref:methionine ABC transporter ATP-binding protein n=1 Tax=Staphylococcus pasteuri TaxID=45972 RepID=UPI001E62681E|nr:methionine ABC transporter ATP-binding protein [Staphylococcus pasteuri]MCD9067798.1 methionine ABC transporter ATP-binding protein [Staphylococcus pasteuri]WAE41643.1 methionine ABC transporter ATP-binding protein [Staphylococcus pasteuri]